MTGEQQSILNDFIDEQELLGRREQGIKGLRVRARKIFEYMNENGLTLREIGIKQAYDFQGWIIDKGKGKYAVNTIKSYVTAAASLFNYLKRKKIIYANPFLEMKRLRREIKLPRNILKEKEMGLFLTELSRFDEEKDLKNRITKYKIHVASELMYSTGLRIAELSSLKLDDIDFELGLVRVVEGKQGFSRIAFLNEYAKKVLSIFVNEMREHVFNEWNRRNNLLFGAKRESFDKTMNKVLKKASSNLKLLHFTTHSFRHSLGFHLLRAGCDIRYIQGILGHKALTSTEIYTRVEKEDLKEVFSKFHPRQFKGADNETLREHCKTDI
jgi:site-specific recombinase XerD